MSTWKPRKSHFFWVFFGPKRFFSAKTCLFRFWCTFYTQVGNSFVNLNLIWLIRKNCQTFCWSFLKKPEKPVFSTIFWPKKVTVQCQFRHFYCCPPLQSNRRLCCTFLRDLGCRVKLQEWKTSWKKREPKTTRASLEKFAKAERK